MKSLWPLLTGVVLLVPSAARLEGSPAAVDPAERGHRVSELLTRLDRAERLLLEPQEIARWQAQRADLLQRASGGGTISEAELVQLLRNTSEREQAAIRRLARQFRVQVYKTFRTQRGVFTRRRAAWNRAQTLWKAAGGRFEDQDRLLDWLQLALKNSMPETPGPLPDDPVFDTRPSEPTVEATSPPAEPIPQPATPAAPLPVDVPTFPTPRPSDRLRDVAGPGVPRQPEDAEVELPRSDAAEPTPLPPSRVADRPPLRPETVGGPVPAVVRRPVALPAVEPSAPSPAAVPFEPVPRDTAAAATPPLPQKTDDGQSSPFPTMEDPFAQPVVTEPPGTRHVAAGSEAAETVGVNVRELSARIAGVNRALQTLDLQLDKDRRLGARQLGPLLDQLGELTIRLDDLALFRRLISGEQQARVGRLDSPRKVISLLGARIFEARTRAAGRYFPGTDFQRAEDQRTAELRHLDALSRALAELTLKK